MPRVLQMAQLQYLVNSLDAAVVAFLLPLRLALAVALLLLLLALLLSSQRATKGIALEIVCVFLTLLLLKLSNTLCKFRGVLSAFK